MEIIKKSEEEKAKVRRVYDHTHGARSVNALPKDVKYWALTESSMRYDSGYQDHRGNPEYSTADNLEVTWFDDEEPLQEWIIDAHKKNKTFKIVQATPVSVAIKATVSVTLEK